MEMEKMMTEIFLIVQHRTELNDEDALTTLASDMGFNLKRRLLVANAKKKLKGAQEKTDSKVLVITDDKDWLEELLANNTYALFFSEWDGSNLVVFLKEHIQFLKENIQ